ncbi:VanW family protein [Bacillus sp. KH172YL63]|uniref:VanW family protein n=1 Tax=Bacillus sp. KH172YL63 TaxID=2709784 RepID=UPI0013E4D0A5|nr:VanW family protein [Bacillus sp. KH172YL63]BCB05007.1 hypothetical protein KH172YL63_31400 [Bacillus sp. KH172YL63]
MKQGLLIKLMTVLFLSTFFLYGFSHLGVYAYESFFVQSLKLSKNAAVASINLGGISREEAVKRLGEKVEEWKNSQNIILEYSGESVKLDPSIFTFHLEESIERLENNPNTSLIVSVDQPSFDAFLSGQLTDYHAEELNVVSLQEYLISLVGSLQVDEGVNISDYITSNESAQVIFEAVSNELEITPTVKNFIDNFPTIPIAPNSQFSFADFLESEGFVVESQADLSPVSSLLYQISLHSNFSIIERNISKQLPDYVSLGFEAKFNPMNNQDFVITNPNATGYELKLGIDGNRIKAQLHGVPFPNAYNVRLSDKETFAPRTIKQFSPFVDKGTVDTVQQGEDGVLIRVYKQKLSSSGEILSEELINEDFYAPLHKIAVYPLEEHEVNTTEGDFDNIQDQGEDESGDPAGEEDTNPTPPSEDSEGEPSQDQGDEASKQPSSKSSAKSKSEKKEYK